MKKKASRKCVWVLGIIVVIGVIFYLWSTASVTIGLPLKLGQLCNPSEDNCVSGTKCTSSTGDKFVCKQILKIGQECEPNRAGLDYLDMCDKSEGLTCKETNETKCGIFSTKGEQECFIVYRCQK